MSEASVFGIDEKRFYVPGVVVEVPCPYCGAKVERNFGRDYLAYPTANEPIMVAFVHEADNGQEHDFDVKMLLSVRLEVVK